MDSLPSLPSLPPVLAEGRHWLVIDKPAGIAVHPGPKTPASLEALLPQYAPNRPVPQPVHRLDRDTSGCLLLAKRHSALRALSEAFSTGSVRKTYWAIVTAEPASDEGRVDQPLLKQSSRADGWRMVVDARGKGAVTDWRVLGRKDGRALIEFRPLTGRTHQIRVHATYLSPGCAIVGDPVYGVASHAGMMLHSHELDFPEPGAEVRNRAVAPMPARFMAEGFSSPDQG